jgi:glucose uptake protein GlcU
MAIFMVLTAAFLWGSWMQATKYTGDFPLPAFLLWLYGFSLVLVWGFIFLIEGFDIGWIFDEIGADPWRAWFVMICGAGMALGIQLQMTVIGRVGLVLSNSVNATFGILLGTLLSAVLGKLPEGVSYGKVFLTALLLICATTICQYSGKLRDQDLERKSVRPASTQDTKSALLMILSAALNTMYALGLSLGVKTSVSTGGFSQWPCIGLLATGSFLGTLAFSGVQLTRHRQWNTMFNRKYQRAYALACLSGACHYGGNLIHTVSSAVISVSISWLLGRTGSMWTYLWGIYHKEYKGASKKTYAVLFTGILIYVLGIILLAYSLYG